MTAVPTAAPTPDDGPSVTARYAGIVSRGAAAIIDVIVFAALSAGMLFFLQAFVAMVNTEPFGESTIGSGVAAFAISWLLLFYFAGSWAVTGRTLGEGLMGLRVVRAKGGRVKALRSFVRFLFTFVSLAFLGLGFAWMLIDRRRRTWQDIVARTVVVYDFDEHGVHHALPD